MYLDRDSSELEYHGRVLARAADRSLPVLDRVKFLAIFTTLTDEFFQVRLSRQPGRSGANRVEAGRLRARYDSFAQEQERLWNEEVLPDLREAGLAWLTWSDLDDHDRNVLSERFRSKILPVLTPLAVGPAHPFPFVSDQSLNIGALLDDGYESTFGRVKIPSNIDRFQMLTPSSTLDDDDATAIIATEELVGAHLDEIFPGRSVSEWGSFRVTRDADYAMDDDVVDLRSAMTDELEDRRFRAAVRLEIDRAVSTTACELLREQLDLSDDEVFVRDRPLGLGDLWEIHGLDRPDLKEPTPPPVVPSAFADPDVDLFAVLDDRDVLVHHPYESFELSTQRFITDAAADEAVRAIKQTLYRTSGDSPIVTALMTAAGRGRQVAVLVELRARFDEEANIGWAEQMESRGVHVVYGFVDIKTHTKTALVVRADPDGTIRRYAHFGTGNYNPDTAHHYEDLGFFTSDPTLTADLAEMFNMLTSHSRTGVFERLLVAPVNLLERLIELISDHAHPGGQITLKANSLTHTAVIDALRAAARAGCEVDLIIRGACRLRPDDSTDGRVRVRSIVGPVLEHSRIFRFGAAGEDREYYIGSADLMVRNLENRVEAVVPVDDERLRTRLDDILQRCLDDNELAWSLDADGAWSPVAGSGRNVQRELSVVSQMADDRSTRKPTRTDDRSVRETAIDF